VWWIKIRLRQCRHSRRRHCRHSRRRSSIDVIESINTRITELENADGTINPALEAHVNAINSCVEDNSAAITTLRNDSDGPGADPGLEAHVNAIDSCVEDHSAAIASLENQLVINVDGGEFINRK